MDDDVINDLKQFIAATVIQQTSDLQIGIDNLDKKISSLDKKLSTKIDKLFESVGEAMEQTNQATDTQLKDHELRIGQLEIKLV